MDCEWLYFEWVITMGALCDECVVSRLFCLNGCRCTDGCEWVCCDEAHCVNGCVVTIGGLMGCVVL